MLIITMSGSTLIMPPQDVHQFPATATLKSSNGGRKIELSSDGGTEYYVPTYSTNTATMLVVQILYPITHIKFTGALGDTAILVS